MIEQKVSGASAENAGETAEVVGDSEDRLMTGAEVAVKYLRYIRQTSFYVCGNLDLADEIASRVTHALVRMRQRKFTDKGIKAYTSKAARSKLANYYNEERKCVRCLSLEGEEGNGVLNFMKDRKAIGPLDALCTGEVFERLEKAMKRLDECDRNLLELKYYQGLNYNEIVELTGINIGTVKSRVYRALESMRYSLKDSRASTNMGYSLSA
jgi:RNA polymerase sigma-70 factor (ECF subfamily)